MYKEAIRPAWVEVNLSNLDYNIKSIAKKAGDKDLIGVIKADAYGHGSVKVAEVLRENGVKTLAVATLQEGVTLREAGAQEEIIILGLTPDMYADVVVDNDFTATCCDSENAKVISDAAVAKGKVVKLMIAVDTGMGRIGYQADDPATAIEDLKKIQALPGVTIRGMMSTCPPPMHRTSLTPSSRSTATTASMKLSPLPASICPSAPLPTALPSWRSPPSITTLSVPASSCTAATPATKWIPPSWTSSPL